MYRLHTTNQIRYYTCDILGFGGAKRHPPCVVTCDCTAYTLLRLGLSSGWKNLDGFLDTLLALEGDLCTRGGILRILP